LPNQLSILLISDKLTNVASVSLSVGVGSLSDGKIYGLAHYLEHMLFMGNEKYPNEDYYQTLVAKCGGGTNAYTDTNHTNYYFYVDPSKLSEVLDVFGHFFIDPLLKTDSLEREMNAVNAEHQKNLTNDGWRTMQARKLMSRKNSPLYNFSTGSLDTLKVKTIKQDVDDFYKKYYSANLMSLVVLSTQSLDDLEHLVTNIFKDVPNNNIRHGYTFPKLFENKQCLIELVPIKNEDTLVMLWDLEYSSLYKNNHIIDYICYIVGHEGTNTLAYLLKKKKWITSLYCGIDGDIGKRTIFQVAVDLTLEGNKYIDVIIQLLLYYIQLIKHYDLPSKYYDEMATIASQNFMFSDKQSPQDYVSALSSKILLNRDIHIINILANYTQFEPFDTIKYLIEDYLKMLTYENMHVIFSSQKYRNMTTRVDKWYGVQYNIYNDLENISYPHNIQDDDFMYEIVSQLELPKYNIYISPIDTFTIIPGPKKSRKYPIKDKIGQTTFYYKYNEVKQIPKTNLLCIIGSEWLDGNKKNDVIIMLFLNILAQITTCTKYMYSYAGYNSNISTDLNKLIIVISGPSQKINIVLDHILFQMINCKISKDIFEDVKTNKLRKIANYIFDPPYIQSSQYLMNKLSKCYLAPAEHIELLNQVTYDDLTCIQKILHHQLYVKCFIHGNESFESAKKYVEIINSYIKPIDVYNKNIESTYIINKHTNILHIEYSQNIMNSVETNSATSIGINLGYITYGTANWCRKIMIMKIFDAIIGTRFFDQLRTKEQLGYIAKSQIKAIGYTENPLHLHYYIVQSPTQCAEYVKDRMMHFIQSIEKILLDVSDDEIQTCIQSEINYYQSPFNNVGEEFAFYSNIIAEGHDIFNVKELKLMELYKITNTDLLEFYKTYYVNGTSWKMLVNPTTKCNGYFI